ncbi:MAG: protein kinase [Planctomycetota bacterium]
MDELIHRAVQTIVDLGIATQAALAPYLQAWTNRPASMDTQDDEQQLATFLTELFKAQVITRNQGRTLLGMLMTAPRQVPAEVAPPPAAPQPLPEDAYIGKRFGSFVAEELVGEGAMGRVYRAAREGTLERDFVIKVFGSKDADAVERFRREAEVMSRLDHPNIVKVVASGQEGSVPFMVLEYVEGPTLHEMLRERGKFSSQSATRAIKQIALALQVAHEQGIVHRDLKPANVLVARGGMLKLFDFGLAKVTSHSSLSQAGDVLGSPAFIAPEQWGDHEVDHRADLFSLGVIYYLMIAGKPPFRGRTAADYAQVIQSGVFQPLREAAPGTEPYVCDLVHALLEGNRAYRPPTAKALIQDLDRVLRGKAPNLLRFEAEGADERVMLVGKDSYRVGSERGSDVRMAGLSALQATLERTAAGIVLRSHGRPEDVRVNGNPVVEIVLRDRDQVRFGSAPPLVFRTGHFGATARHSAQSERLGAAKDVRSVLTEPLEPIPIPGLLHAALVQTAHARALVSCFEQLDPRTRERSFERSRRALLSTGMPSDELEAALERARELSRERCWDMAERLFERTRENLGREVEPWLQWWLDAGGGEPIQFRPPGERARGRLEVETPDGQTFEVDLGAGEVWTVGRADEAEITIPDRSVSRQHIQLVRLNTRYLFRDLGSRFGVRVADERRDVGLLRDGDKLELGKVKLVFRDDLERQPLITQPLVEVDPFVFQALVERRSRATVVTLVRLLDTAPLADFCVGGAAPHEDFSSVGVLVMEFLEQERQRALEALPELSGGVQLGEDAAGWSQWLNHEAPRLPAQAVPAGWTR